MGLFKTVAIIPQTELALRGPGGEKRDIYSLAGTCPQKCRMHFVQGFIAFFAFWCQECANYARKVPLILCTDIFLFLHSAGSRLPWAPGCLQLASLRASGVPKIFHEESLYFKHSLLKDVNISWRKRICSSFVIAKCHHYIWKRIF